MSLTLVDGDGAAVETETVTLSLLGEGATEQVEFWFEQDPSQLDRRFDVGSYAIP